MLSQQGQTFLTRKGRLPTRPDVATNPPGVMDILRQRKIIVTISSAAEKRKIQQTFSEISGRIERPATIEPDAGRAFGPPIQSGPDSSPSGHALEDVRPGAPNSNTNGSQQ